MTQEIATLTIEKEPLSEFEYVDRCGACCPWCQSTTIIGEGPLKPDGNTADQNIECSECGKAWIDNYTLTGYSLEDGSPVPNGDPISVIAKGLTFNGSKEQAGRFTNYVNEFQKFVNLPENLLALSKAVEAKLNPSSNENR